jgi:hypothetical protein
VMALSNARRSVLAHTLYWGTLLSVYAPLVNLAYQPGKNVTDFEPLLCAVMFILGARAVENGLVWYPHLLSAVLLARAAADPMMDHDLAPLLNEPLQREVLWATVEGIAKLVRTPDPMLSARRCTVELDAGQGGGDLGNEKRVLFVAILPMLLASLAAGVTAVLVNDISSYLALVLLGFALVILAIVWISWSLASYQRRDRMRASVIEHAPHQFMQLRALLGQDEDVLVRSLREAAELGSRAKFSTSGGRSGAFVFPTLDGRFILKTIHQGARGTCAHAWWWGD